MIKKKIKNKAKLNLAPRTRISGQKNIVLCPNCSEMCFRIGGNLEEIRQEMYNIIEWTRKEYTGEVGEIEGGKEKLHPSIKKSINEVKKQIKEAKSLEDFEKIVIDFTCNYETFFKKDGDDSLLVATCNNYEWSDVSKQDTNDDYYDVAGFTHYILVDNIEGYQILKLEYDDEDHKKFPLYIFPDKGQIFFDEHSDYDTKPDKLKKGKSTKLVIRQDKIYQLQNNHLVKVREIKDKVLLNKIKILANLGGLK